MLETRAPAISSWKVAEIPGFHAYAVHRDGEVVLIDPVALSPAQEAKLRTLGTVKAVLLTGPNHERESAALSKTFGVPVYAHSAAIAQFDSKAVQPLPETLPLGLVALEADGAFEGEVVYYHPDDGGSLLVGDSWHNERLARFPWLARLFIKHVIRLRDGLHLTPPSKARNSQALIAQSRAWLEQPVERLLVSHGDCLLSGAGIRMRERLDQGA
ncbi:MAG TPA: hypothetical protein V6D47_01420 [Oscillatoriaceae cyanobacterium]